MKVRLKLSRREAKIKTRSQGLKNIQVSSKDHKQIKLLRKRMDQKNRMKSLKKILIFMHSLKKKTISLENPCLNMNT